MESFPEDFLERCRSITAKRARTVIDHLLEHGQISTEEIKNTYGYNHPPRAIRDVREIGIPIETFTITGSDGRKMDCNSPKDAHIFPNNSKHRSLRSMEAVVFSTVNPCLGVNSKLTIAFLMQ
jgi:Helix-turn-helix domain